MTFCLSGVTADRPERVGRICSSSFPSEPEPVWGYSVGALSSGNVGRGASLNLVSSAATGAGNIRPSASSAMEIVGFISGTLGPLSTLRRSR